MQLKRIPNKKSQKEKMISDEIFNALGTHKKFSFSQKRNFADIVAAELPYWASIAEAASAKREDFDNAKQAARKLEKTLNAFKFQFDKNTDFQAITNTLYDSGYNFNLEDSISFITKFNEEISKYKSPKKNSRQAEIIAKNVAKFYKKYLLSMPSSSKSDVFSPYENVCDVVGKTLKIEIKKPTMNKVVKALKNKN